MVWLFGALFCFTLIFRYISGAPPDNDSHYPLNFLLDRKTSDSPTVCVTGSLKSIEHKPNSDYLYLKKVLVNLPSGGKSCSFSDILVICDPKAADSLLPGNRLWIEGALQSFSTPTNPGQFDEKSYYREKNIYYKVYGKTIKLTSARTDFFPCILLALKNRLGQFYQSHLPPEYAGIVTAMLLGDKASLQKDIKELYTISGIGHILAISGLHISILCMLLSFLLGKLPLPRHFSFLITAFFLISYASMTGFGISVNRAVIMMIAYLFAREIGRSYDALSALAFSAVITLVAKPDAVFSCTWHSAFTARTKRASLWK